MRKKLTLAANTLSGLLKPQISKMRRRIRSGHIGVIFHIFGPAAGVKAFWSSPFVTPKWYDVERRLNWLAQKHPQMVPRFVACAVEQAMDPDIIVGLAQSTLSDDHLRPLLTFRHGQPPACLLERLEKGQVFAAAYVGAQMLLDGPEVAQTVDTYVRSLHLLPRDRYERYLDSLSFFPAKDATRRSFQSGYHAPKSHRLIVIEGAQSVHNNQHLLRDATQVSIIDMNDLYGKVSLDKLDIRGVETIQIEHMRTRITRFSPEYHTLHEQTKAAAFQIMQHFENLQGADTTLFDQASAHLTLDLADMIFFESLKVRALANLLDDPQFDHIVIAHQYGPGRPYDQLLSCLPQIQSDPRVEFVSIGMTVSQRLAARKMIIAATHPQEIHPNRMPPADIAEIKEDLRRKVEKRVERLDPLPSDDRQRLLMITGNNPAYNGATAASMASLSEMYQLNVVFAGGSIMNFIRNNATAEAAIADVNPITISHRLLPNLADLSRWLQHHFQNAAQTIETKDIRAVTTTFTKKIVGGSLLPGVSDYAFMKGWFEKLRADQQLPGLVIVSPPRNPKLGTLSEATRQFGVPSLALEPHGVNGNYCRYAKVSMDYYGVISDYFRRTSETDFGIPQDRCRVIGSPRIAAPADYDPSAAQAQARKDLRSEQDLTFVADQRYGSYFCQPLQWDHTAKVWRNIIEASQDLGITLLLKTHPEESKARVARYLTIAHELGAEHRVISVDGDPNTIIMASDFVLTGYSTAAIDAAVLQKPILCVTADDEPYPLEQHEIVHSTLCGNAKALRNELLALRDHPEEIAKRSEAFRSTEPQFISGPEAYLQTFVADILKTDPADVMRAQDKRPAHLFLDGPFPVFNA